MLNKHKKAEAKSPWKLTFKIAGVLGCLILGLGVETINTDIFLQWKYLVVKIYL